MHQKKKRDNEKYDKMRNVGAQTQKKWGPAFFSHEGWGPEGGGHKISHTTAREPKRADLRVPASKNTTKIQREDSQREKKSKNGSGKGEKKRAKFWAVWRRGGF